MGRDWSSVKQPQPKWNNVDMPCFFSMLAPTFKTFSRHWPTRVKQLTAMQLWMDWMCTLFHTLAMPVPATSLICWCQMKGRAYDNLRLAWAMPSETASTRQKKPTSRSETPYFESASLTICDASCLRREGPHTCPYPRHCWAVWKHRNAHGGPVNGIRWSHTYCHQEPGKLHFLWGCKTEL